MSAQFTPGPWTLRKWRVGNRERHRAIYARIAPGHYPEGVLAHTMGSRTAEMNDANAALIAAAPELYEALERAASLLEDAERETNWSCGDPYSDEGPIKDFMALLAKARGEA